MRCPYCRSPLRETSPECPACRLSFSRVKALLGPVPRLTPGISDNTRLIGPLGARRIRAALDRLRRRYPQINPHVVLREFPGPHPFELQVFWLFNAGGLSAEDQKGSANRAVLLAIDPPNGRAAIMVGYGLEPFLGDEALDRLIEIAGPSWRAGKFSDGILTVLRGLDHLLAGVIDALPETAGLRSPPPVREQHPDF